MTTPGAAPIPGTGGGNAGSPAGTADGFPAGTVGQGSGLPPNTVKDPSSGLPVSQQTEDQESAKEPTVVSSTNVSENEIPNNTEAINNYDTGGVTVGEDGLARYGDGSFATAPSGATQNPDDGTYSSGGISYAIGPNTSKNPDTQNMYDMLTQLKGTTDASTQAQLASIESTYANLTKSAEDANKGNSKATNNALLLNGDTRYAPADAASEATMHLNTGLNFIANLQAKAAAAIQTAKTAQQNQDYKLASQQLAIAKQAQTQKQTAARELSSKLLTVNQKKQASDTAAQQDNAIISEVSAGNTDPAKILQNLQAKGINVTAKQVATALKSIGTTGTTSGNVFKLTSSETGKLLQSGVTPQQIKDLDAFYNGTGDSTALSSLTSQQQDLVRTLMNPPAKTGKAKVTSSGSMTYSNSQLTNMQSWLDATKGTDGYVDPNAYQQLFDAWTKDGGLAKDFLKNFPPKSYINPSNTDLPKYLESKTTSSSASSGGVSAADIQALFPGSGQ